MQQKDCGFVTQVEQGGFPFPDGPGCDEFVGKGEVARDAERRSFAAGGSDRLQELLVAIRRFDEYLGLIGGNGVLFQFNDFFYTLAVFNRQVAMKRKVLAIQSGGHQCEKNGGGADERNYPDVFLVSQAYQSSPWIGYCRAAGFR